MALRLRITDWVDATRWRWLLEDDDGRFIADHTVRLDASSREFRGFCNLPEVVDFYAPLETPQAQVRSLGGWVGQQVFGGLCAELRKRGRAPAEAVRVLVPEQARVLLDRPFEVACFADGKRFDEAGVRFVYQAESGSTAAKLEGASLRLLAVFSLPARANPLNLRRERHGLQQLVRRLAQARGFAVDLRVLHYGATRDTLREALEEGDSWDVVHLSGHGLHGEILLECPDGSTDRIDAEALAELLAPARDRLKLLLLDSCYSGASSHEAARVQVGLDAARSTGADESTQAGPAEGSATPLPSLGYALAEQLDCAVLAMRYPVGDSFATDLMLSLYEKLLDKGQKLPASLQLALRDALTDELSPSALAVVTPLLIGARAATLQFVPPRRPPGAVVLPQTGLSIGFPREPERFVGRLQTMLRASQVLAPEHAKRAVLFHGMPGAGKSACALELAYRHELGRFTGHVWYKAPEAGSDIATALFSFMFEIQRQLNAPDLGLTTALDDPARFRDYTLPRLRALLEQNSWLLVLDNLETLLTDSDQWRIPLWGEVIEALLSHTGLSRVVITSRRVPAPLLSDARVQVEPIHALSFAESVLLARELPQLGRLFADEAGRALLQRTLRVVQGHPKLMELADALAADRAALEQRVVAGEAELATQGEVLDAFFAKGGAREGESRQPAAQFVQALQGWTAGVLGRLSPAAQLLFTFLCRLEPEDRTQRILQVNWRDFLTRLGEANATATAALAAPEQSLPAALEALRAAGLVEVSRPAIDPQQLAQLQALVAGQAGSAGAPDAAAMQQLVAALTAQATTYAIHPGVAEAARAAADAVLLAAADVELAAYHQAVVGHWLKAETEGGSETVAEAARRGVPYLLREQRWDAASHLLEELLRRDTSPEAVAFALPLLERIAAATAGTERELIDQGILAKALRMAGRRDEAERKLRDLCARARAQGEFRLASAAAGDLVNLLATSGRLQEALAVIDEMSDDIRRAGLGPWTQLAGKGRRLRVLAAMGQYDTVLEEVERLRAHMATLPESSEAEEAADAWNVRESLLDTGRSAALGSRRWAAALALNAEIVKLTATRGATALELARTRFNDYGPLLELERFAEARTLLMECRRVFEAERAVGELGGVFSALADLECRTGDPKTAAEFEQVALGYRYQAGDPADCAVSHCNLGNYLAPLGADPAGGLAHRLASAVLELQMQSGGLSTDLRNLSNSGLPATPPPFAEVVAQVEAVPGVRFAALFKRLPRTFPDGDAALAALWQMVAEERARRATQTGDRQAVLASLPPAVRAAFELDGEAFAQALRDALAALPEAEAGQMLARLRAAGLLGGGEAQQDRAKELQAQFEPLLQAIAAAAQGDATQRAELEALLADLETKGFKLAQPVQRLWAGERDESALVAGLDAVDAQLVRRLLQLVVLASMPPAVRAAFELDGDAFAQALRDALAALPEAEAGQMLVRLRAAGLIGGGEAQPDRAAELKAQFEPLLQAIAAVAQGDAAQRAELEALLADLETRGFKLAQPVQRLWAGERDVAVLTRDLDETDTALVRRVLALLGE
jgi:hypothetical protein